MKYKIPFIRPKFPDSQEMAKDYRKIQESNWYTNFGPFEQQFRQKIESYIGNNIHAVTVSNATAGLILALKNILPKPTAERKKVIMPSFTFVAGASSLRLLGYEPVFVDISPEDLQPDAKSAREYLEKPLNRKEVCGLLLCNTFGVGGPSIDEWELLAAEMELPLVVDSAAGFGSMYEDGTRIGGRGDCEVFSFHATKPFAIGEGGAVVCSDEALAAQIRRDSNFGFGENHTANTAGVNAKMPEFLAAIGVRQFDSIDENLKNRRNVLDRYKQTLQPYDFRFQRNDENSAVSFATCIAKDAQFATKFSNHLEEQGVQHRKYYNPPIHRHLPFAQSGVVSDLVTTEDICSRILSLPVHDGVDQSVIDSMIQGF
jgi:dTDP-4-amino-4,6-dideoxygalactose transaminase